MNDEEEALIIMGATGAGKTTERTLGSIRAAVARATAHAVLLA
jgi:nucleotide-binding universal stress UspA family protein